MNIFLIIEYAIFLVYFLFHGIKDSFGKKPCTRTSPHIYFLNLLRPCMCNLKEILSFVSLASTKFVKCGMTAKSGPLHSKSWFWEDNMFNENSQTYVMNFVN